MNARDMIDTGDRVFHRPTRETWLVALADGDRVYWCGWPYGTAEMGDCLLTYKATPVERHELLLELAKMNDPGDRRCRHARRVLQEIAAAVA